MGKSQLSELKGPFQFLREHGVWLNVVIAAGAALRFFFVFFTEGSLDVEIWEGHAQAIGNRGLIAYYHGGQFTFNHPPPMGLLAAGLYSLAAETGLSFPFLLRLPFLLLDAGTAFLLYTCLSQANSKRIREGRYVLASLYWLSPVAAIFSSYHGNSDSAVAFFLLAATFSVLRGHPIWAGLMIGLSCWVKIPGILAIPILLLALPDVRARIHFCLAAGGAALVGYLPWLVQDPEAVIRSVVLYRGLMIQTTLGTPIWGIQIFYPDPASLSPTAFDLFATFRNFYYQWNTVIALVPLTLYALLRDRSQHAEDIMAGIAGSYLILYGLTNFWAFQYLAWSLPFWLVLRPRLAIPALGLTFLYIYGLYAWLCGNPFLLGEWAFIDKNVWPLAVRLLRDACVLFFFFGAFYLVGQSIRESLGRWRRAGAPLSWLQRKG